jgi:hypothetical protein
VDKPLTLNQLAIRTGLPRAWLKCQALEGRIPCLHVGNELLFNLRAVNESLLEMAASRPEAAHA